MNAILKEELPEGITWTGWLTPAADQILTPEALTFVRDLSRRFSEERKALLVRRVHLQKKIDQGVAPKFLYSTKLVRDGSWKIKSIPPALQDRRVEITGPVDAKMVINGLNSGAKVFMADFEDATSPTWQNIIEGQINLKKAIEGSLSFTNEKGKTYELNKKIATLLVRPRGWHLQEKHLLVDGEAISASLFDFGMYFFHNAKKLIEKGHGPYFYLPKLENHLEARLWNEVFIEAQEILGLPIGTIKTTVLIENVLAAFEMEEILYELREHIVALNAGRWDYIFSAIKKFRNAEQVFPDRAQVGMTAPFMRAYTDLLVQTCHRRGAHAIGGMSAFIPSRRDEEVNKIAIAKVQEDKERETKDGFDGTWVAHPDLVPVAKTIFDRAFLPGKTHQKHILREDVNVEAKDLLNFEIEGGKITEEGLRNNVSVALLYLESWLQGLGAVGIHNLMEDAATAEISRSQVWQWIRKGSKTEDGKEITLEHCRECIEQEAQKIRETLGTERFATGKFDQACRLFEQLSTSENFADFLTLSAYEQLN